MVIKLVRRRELPDGRMEEYVPEKRHGFYVLADRAVDPQHNKAVNQFYVKDLEAVAARLRRGGVSLRMQGRLSGQKNLISAKEIEIEESAPTPTPQKRTDTEDDPFSTFSEWASDADESAYASL